MVSTTALLIAGTVYGALLAFAAQRARRRTHTRADLFLASRRVGPWLTALGFVANAPNAWMLMSVGMAAFTWGLSAAWLWPAVLIGQAICWFYVAPRLAERSATQDSLTLIGTLSAEVGEGSRVLVARSAILIAALALLIQIGAQSLAVAQLFGELELSGTMLVVTFAALVVVVVLGGYWAISLLEAAQVLILTVTLVLLALYGLVALDGWAGMRDALVAAGPQANTWLGERNGVVALAFVLGVFGIGLAMPGQPYAVLRFMGARGRQVLRSARWMSLGCSAVLVVATLSCGWSARALYAAATQPDPSLLAFASSVLSPQVGAFVLAVAAGSLAVGVASPLLSATATVLLDGRNASQGPSLGWARFGLVVCAVVAAVCIVSAPATRFERVLFAWSAMGAAFGPLLLVRLSGKRVRPGSTLGAMWAGFTLTLLFHLLPDAPGDFLERVLPFVTALGIALSGGERRRNPDRADRTQQTVHDRVPI